MMYTLEQSTEFYHQAVDSWADRTILQRFCVDGGRQLWFFDVLCDGWNQRGKCRKASSKRMHSPKFRSIHVPRFFLVYSCAKCQHQVAASQHVLYLKHLKSKSLLLVNPVLVCNDM